MTKSVEMMDYLTIMRRRIKLAG